MKWMRWEETRKERNTTAHAYTTIVKKSSKCMRCAYALIYTYACKQANKLKAAALDEQYYNVHK